MSRSGGGEGGGEEDELGGAAGRRRRILEGRWRPGMSDQVVERHVVLEQ